MGALYEDVERFFGDIFAAYGRVVARWPLVFIGVSLVTCSLLGLGLLRLRAEHDVTALYSPVESQSLSDRARILRLFPDRSGEDFRFRQSVLRPQFASVLVTPTLPGDNLLVAPPLEQVKKLYHLVENISFSDANGRKYEYGDVCARRDGECVVDGAEVLKAHVQANCYVRHHESIETYVYELQPQQAGNHSSFYPPASRPEHQGSGSSSSSSSTSAHRCPHAHALRLRFFLRLNFSADDDRALLWQRRFLRVMHDYAAGGSHPLIKVDFRVSDGIELYENTGQELRLLPLALTLMGVIGIAVGGGGDWVSTNSGVALAGLVASAAAILASLGAMGIVGVPFVDLCTVAAFLVLGTGMQATLLLISAWRRTNIRAPVEERISETYRQVSLPLTLMSLTDLLVVTVGATGPAPAVRAYCACAGVAVLFSYINQLSFIGGCLVLNSHRTLSSRHCVTCLRTKSRRQLQDNGIHPLLALLLGGHLPRRAGEDEHACIQYLPSDLYPRLLLRPVARGSSVILYAAYLTLSIWGLVNLDVGFHHFDLLPDEAHRARYLAAERQHFYNTSGPVVTFVIDNRMSYEQPEVQDRIDRLLQQARASAFIDSTGVTSWLDDYRHFLHQTAGVYNPHNFVSKLQHEFLPAAPQYKGDVVIDTVGTSIVASRFFVYSLPLSNSTAQLAFLGTMHRLAKEAALPVTAFSPDFVLYEHHVTIIKSTLLTSSVTLISMLLVALMFIPHPTAVIAVTLSMLSVVVGVLGLLHVLHLPLNAMQTPQVLLSIGLSSNYSVYLSHTFMTATGKGRVQRVHTALEKVGGTLTRESFILLTSLSVLALGRPHLLPALCSISIIAVMVSLLHAIIFLPILLSFVGPCQASHPKSFSPVLASPTTSGGGSDFSAHIYSTPSSWNGDGGGIGGTSSGALSDSELLRSNTETSNPISDILEGTNHLGPSNIGTYDIDQDYDESCDIRYSSVLEE